MRAREQDTHLVSVLLSLTGPQDRSRLTTAQLRVLAREIRELLIAKVTATVGHLGPNLGIVEISLALHRVFDSLTDRILFNARHHAYVHKILTGQHTDFDRLHRADGVSGCPSHTESAHDVIENSHASTALSCADGLAKAHALQGTTDRHVVAVVGDGALTGGMALEALNHTAAAPQRAVIIVLNDNGRSYARTIGGLSHLTDLRAGDGDRQGRHLFDALGLDYLGPVHEHVLTAVEQALRDAVALGGPVVTHCVTVKGKGYHPAETQEANCLHAVGIVDPVTGAPVTTTARTWTDVFSEQLCGLGRHLRDIVTTTAAMPGPTGLAPFRGEVSGADVRRGDQRATRRHLRRRARPGRAAPGRGDLFHLAVSRVRPGSGGPSPAPPPGHVGAGPGRVTGPDGASRHGMRDLVMLTAIPGIRVAAPRDPTQLKVITAVPNTESSRPCSR